MGRTETRAGGTERQSAMITPATGRASPIRKRIIKGAAAGTPDPVRRRPRPCMETPPHQEDNPGTNAAKPVHRSIGAKGQVLDASHRPNRWALDTSSDPATRPGPLSRRLEQAPLPIPVRERASKSPAGFHAQVITVQGQSFVLLAGARPSGCLMRPGADPCLPLIVAHLEEPPAVSTLAPLTTARRRRPRVSNQQSRSRWCHSARGYPRGGCSGSLPRILMFLNRVLGSGPNIVL